MLRWRSARMSVNSACSPFVSWYSSTRMWRKCSCSISRILSCVLRSFKPFTRRSSKSIELSSSFRAAYFSATFAISSGSTPAVFVCHLAAIISIGFDSFAASEIIFATTSFFGELLLVVLVEDLEAARIADGTAVAPEEPRAYRVERAGPELAYRVADELFRPLAHLARRAVGKGQEEYAVGGNAVLYEKRDAVHERARLASSCGGEHEERPVARRSRRALFRIE